MGKFLKDALLGFAKGSAEVAKQEYEADLQKRKIMDETPELIKRYQAQGDVETEKKKVELRDAIIEKSNQVEQLIKDNPGAYGSSEQKYMRMWARTGGTATALAKGAMSPKQTYDEETGKLVWRTPEQLSGSDNADDRYTGNKDLPFRVPKNVIDEARDNANFLHDMTLLNLVLKSPEDLSEEEKDIIKAAGLENYHDIAPAALNYVMGKTDPNIAAEIDKKGAPLRSLVDRLGMNKRHELFMSRVTEMENKSFGHSFISIGNPGELDLDKTFSIINQQLNTDLSESVGNLKDNYRMRDQQVANLLHLHYDENNKDMNTRGFQLDFTVPNYAPKGVTLGSDPKYDKVAPKPTSSNTFDNLPPSPSASASASSLTTPSPVGPNMPMTDPRQAISATSSGGAPMADISQPSQVPTQEGIDAGIPMAVGDKSNSPEVMKARLMALKSKYGIGSTQYKDALTTFKQQYDASQQ